MTNEKKIKSLWYHFCTEKHCAEITQNCQICPKAQAHPQLMEMASWKDQQMIEKSCKLYLEELIQFNNLLVHLNPDYDKLIDIDKSYDDFKKAMEE